MGQRRLNRYQEATWQIDRADIGSLSQAEELTYTGEEQTLTIAGYNAQYMTLGGTLSATNAGTYTAKITLDNNYQLTDGSHGTFDFLWHINKAPGSMSLSTTALDLKASANTATIVVTRTGDGVVSAEINDGNIAQISVAGESVTVTAKSNGHATITIHVGEGTNYLAPQSQNVAVDVGLPTGVLNENSWATIKDVSDAGQGANY